jgi:antitoxin (DNA-binding transcriptional repressor) of toxin-antitoxin stability system
MKKASIRELHTHTSALVRAAAAGEIIVVERRGKPMAELRPLSRKTRKVRFPDMTRIWNTFPQLPGDSARFVEEDRDASEGA